MMRRTGFTLIEVVIAIFVAAVMFALGYTSINQALIEREHINVSQARLTEVQRGMRVIAQDFAQIIARTARDTAGNGEIQPAISSSTRDNTIVTFTRAGWSNPAGVQRPAEQRVRYRFVDGALVREHWLSVDPALNVEPRQRVVLTKVKAVEIRFLDPASREWRTEWPGSTAATVGQTNPAVLEPLLRGRPVAIEFTLVLDDWGRIQRLFETPT
jgi:general secretion pathway protein J